MISFNMTKCVKYFNLKTIVLYTIMNIKSNYFNIFVKTRNVSYIYLCRTKNHAKRAINYNN